MQTQESRERDLLAASAAAGAKGTFIIMKHDVSGMKGSGPNGRVEAADLLTRCPRTGRTIAKDPDRVVNRHEIVSKNKITLRGLNQWFWRQLSPLRNYSLSDITYGTPGSPDNLNPWVAVFLAADKAGDTPAVADLRPTFTESNAQYDTKIPNTSTTAGIGVRAISKDDTSAPGLRRVARQYPTSAPYRELEYTFFDNANTPTYATGAIGSIPVASSINDGDTFVLDDGVNPALTFEMEKTGGVSGSNIPVDISGATTADDVRDAMVGAVNAQSENLLLDATGVIAAQVSLAHRTGGRIGNVTTWASDFGSVTQPTGGGGALEGNGGPHEVDNLPIKAIGFASGVACGNGETNNQIACRSVIGLPPTMKGKADRIYRHEGSNLSRYSGSQKLSDLGTDGYIQQQPGPDDDNHEEQVLASIPSDSGDSLSATGNTIYMKFGTFTQADVGRTARIAGSSSNNGDKTITVVIDKRKIQVSQTLTGEGGGFTCDVVELNNGDAAFDGDIESYIDTGLVDVGFKFRSKDTSGPHEMGRIWQSQQSIRGVRITHPAATPKIFTLDKFKLRYLDPTKAPGGNPNNLEPANDLHWTDVAGHSYLAGSEDDNIFNAGVNGYEYLFTTAINCYGVKISQATASDPVRSIEIAEFYAFSDPPAFDMTAGSNDVLRLATNGVPSGGSPGPVGSFRSYELGDLSIDADASLEGVQDIADAINKQVRGYEIEAVRTPHGYLMLRSTVAGYNSQLDLSAEPTNGAHALLGLGAVQVQKIGETQVVRKLPLEALTIIYRMEISGDLPVAA